MLLGQRCGQRELKFLQHNNAKIPVPTHGPPYLYLYALWRDRGEDKVVTTEGVGCITTQTTRISKNVFFWHFQEEYTGYRDISRVCTRDTWVAMQIVAYLGHAQVLYMTSRIPYAGFLKETRICIKQYHFKGNFWDFKTLVSSRKF